MLEALLCLLLPCPATPQSGARDGRLERLAREEAELRTQVRALDLFRRLQLDRDQVQLLLRCAEEAVAAKRSFERELEQRRARDLEALRAFRREDLAGRGFSEAILKAVRDYSVFHRKRRKALADRLEHLERVFTTSLSFRQWVALLGRDASATESPADRLGALFARTLPALERAARRGRRDLFVQRLSTFLKTGLQIRAIPAEIAWSKLLDELWRAASGPRPARGRALGMRLRSLYARAQRLVEARRELRATARRIYGGADGPVPRLLFSEAFLPLLRRLAGGRRGVPLRSKTKGALCTPSSAPPS